MPLDIPLQPREALLQLRQPFSPIRRRPVANGSSDKSLPGRAGFLRSLFAAPRSSRTEAPSKIHPGTRLTRSVPGRLEQLTRNAATRSAFAWQRIPRARGASAQRPELANFPGNVSLELRLFVHRLPNWQAQSVAMLRPETPAKHDR